MNEIKEREREIELVELVPEGEKTRAVEMSLVRIELDDGDGPLGYVGVERNAAHLEVKALHLVEDLGRIAVADGPVLELPLFALREHGHHATPVLRLQFRHVVDHLELLARAVVASMHNDLAVFHRRVLIRQHLALVLRRHKS